MHYDEWVFITYHTLIEIFLEPDFASLLQFFLNSINAVLLIWIFRKSKGRAAHQELKVRNSVPLEAHVEKWFSAKRKSNDHKVIVSITTSLLYCE